MREIKFRGKTYADKFYPDLSPSKWVYGFITQFPKDFVWMYIGSNDNRVMVKPDTVGQFVGVCDNDDREIFEGDVVRCCYENPVMGLFGGAVMDEEEYVGVVEYRGGSFYIGKHYALDSFRPDEMEVIGNIFDNSDLIKDL